MYLVCGEALFDVFVPEGAEEPLKLVAHAGGSPFNVAIGLSRLGRRAALFTGLSTDALGRRLRAQLAREQVSLDYIVDKARPTTLALVALDPDGVPQYSFYGNGCADRALEHEDQPTLGDDIGGLHLGSYTLVVEPTASSFLALARQAQGTRVISLDPNVRPTVEPDMQVWRERLDVWRALADVVKVSDEDLALLYPGRDAHEIARAWLQGPTRLLVVTRGASGALGYCAQGCVEISAPKVAVVDTVGAGDSFQSALLAQLPDHASLLAASASLAQLERVLNRAAQAAAITCSRPGADPPHAHEMA
jgi:fructokinase